jgi:predicted phosphodiesterase
MKTKVAVVSDIHANADALTVALKEIQNEAVDITIVLGDILTYGCQPVKVINLLKSYNKENAVVFIKGNHDQLYFDLQSNANHISYKPAKFVEESVCWTIKKLFNCKLEEIFDWQNNYFFGDVYFSHANPFKYGDWSYIEDIKNLEKSLKILRDKNFFSGVFGHSHRQLFMGNKKGMLHEIKEFHFSCNLDQLIINTGSIGQPRGNGLGYVVMDFDGNKLIQASFKPIRINFDNSISLIQRADFSSETKEKLIGYLKE